MKNGWSTDLMDLDLRFERELALGHSRACARIRAEGNCTAWGCGRHHHPDCPLESEPAAG